MTDGQYTLDADPMVLAERVQTLERVCDRLTGCICIMARETRVLAHQCDVALCESHPLQAEALYETAERMTELYDMAHAASVMMGRSY